MNAPIIREGLIEQEEGRPHKLKVYGGLHYIRGNAAPHFSLTCWETGPGGYEGGGADHDTILGEYPELADVAALHLSDIDGVPTHAEANGWYWLAGSLGGLGEPYHGGNSSPTRSEAECLDIFARHCRITESEARMIRTMVGEHYVGKDANARARKRWAKLMEGMRSRWKREAETAIERHGLEVYGDPWPKSEEVQA